MNATDTQPAEPPFYPVAPWNREDPKARAAAASALLWVGGLGSIAGIVLGVMARRSHLSRADNDRAGVGITVGAFGLLVSVGLILAATILPSRSSSDVPRSAGPVTLSTPAAASSTVPVTAVRAATTIAKVATPVCPPAGGAIARIARFSTAPPTCIDATKTYTAQITTNLGLLTVALDPKVAPIAVNNFVFLARWKYFDGTTCHRAIPGFMAQCGDPTGTGRGGPGYTIKDELPASGSYKVGSLAMANAGPDTSGSQFFVITGATGTRLPPSYTLLGQVTTGLTDVLPAIDAAGNPDAAANGVPPKSPITITNVAITEQ